MTRNKLCIGILLSWVFGFLTVSGIFFLQKVKEGYGWFYIGGTIATMEQLILIYLYCSIYFIYRRSARTANIHDIASKYEENGSIQSASYTQTLSLSSFCSSDGRGEKCKQSISIERVRVIGAPDKENRLLKLWKGVREICLPGWRV